MHSSSTLASRQSALVRTDSSEVTRGMSCLESSYHFTASLEARPAFEKLLQPHLLLWWRRPFYIPARNNLKPVLLPHYNNTAVPTYDSVGVHNLTSRNLRTSRQLARHPAITPAGPPDRSTSLPSKYLPLLALPTPFLPGTFPAPAPQSPLSFPEYPPQLPFSHRKRYSGS